MIKEKSLLEIDTPRSCCSCKLETYLFYNGKKCLGADKEFSKDEIEDIFINRDYDKPLWCPLRNADSFNDECKKLFERIKDLRSRLDCLEKNIEGKECLLGYLGACKFIKDSKKETD